MLRNLAYIYQQWQRGYPLYCVREELLCDMLKTEVGERLELFSDIQLAIPYFALFFPKNLVKSPIDGGYIDYLIVGHQETNLPEHKHVFFWAGIDSQKSTVLGLKRIRRDGTLMHSYFAGETQEQKDNSLTLRNIVLQTILLLQYYPEEITSQVVSLDDLPQIKGFKRPNGLGLKENAYQLPRWLGLASPKKNYKPKTFTTTGIGTSKSPHFRAGHWRRLEDKSVWVRPAWVHSDSGENARDY